MRIAIPAHVNLYDHLERCRIALPGFCEGSGVCGRCRVRLVEGKLPVTPSDRSFLGDAQLNDGWRLACCAVTQEAVVIELDVPDADKPLHTQAADRASQTQHRYGLVLCGEWAALCDLTAVTITGMMAGAHAAEMLLERYPDAAGGLDHCLCIGGGDVPTLSCEIRSLPHPGTEDAAALEWGITELFRQ